jgi:hypothetical protein
MLADRIGSRSLHRPRNERTRKMDSVKLEIRMGNAAMQSGEDAARALREVAEKLDQGATSGPILDDNGNGVGHFEVS